MGYTIMNGRPVCMLPPGIRMPETVPHALANHNVHEYGRLKALLPLVYEEFGGTFA
jgi:phloretin hydrolase